MAYQESIDWLSTSKPLVATTLLIALWVAESVAPMYLDRRGRVRHGFRNLALGLLNTLVVAMPFASLMLFVTGWAERHAFGVGHWLDGPAWLQWLIVLVLFDVWMYLWHRLNHRVPLLWRFHAVHHSDRDMDATSAFRFHTGEIAMSFMARLAVLPLLGMTMTQLLIYETVLLPVILFHHSNIRLPAWADRLLRWLIVTPRMHWVHHSREQPETDSNYASILSVWDRCFGTFRLRGRPETIQLGLHDEDGGLRWRTLREMIAAPLNDTSPRKPKEGVANEDA
ncbi:MAG: hypothetical protein Kow00105_05550 [Phycisphaeraceae bacterium]